MVARWQGNSFKPEDYPEVTTEQAATVPTAVNNTEYLDKLAKLGVLEYEQQRTIAAKEMKVRPLISSLPNAGN